jgi:hypothetical protein
VARATLAVASAVLVISGLAPAAAMQPVAETTVPANVQAGSGWVDYDSQPMRVNVWHDRQDGDIYRRGESLQVYLESNQDAYAVVYRIDAEGEVTILWPRSRYDDGFIFGHHQYSLPARGGPRLRVGDQVGVEYVEAIISIYPCTSKRSSRSILSTCAIWRWISITRLTGHVSTSGSPVILSWP